MGKRSWLSSLPLELGERSSPTSAHQGAVVKAFEAGRSARSGTMCLPGHPIAGSEKMGIEAASAGALGRHKVYPHTALEADQLAEALTTVTALWQNPAAVAGRGTHANWPDHDEVLAAPAIFPICWLFHSSIHWLGAARESGIYFRLAAGGASETSHAHCRQKWNPVMWPGHPFRQPRCGAGAVWTAFTQAFWIDFTQRN